MTDAYDTDTVLKVDGDDHWFRCKCGCNVFRRVRSITPELVYKCNGCGEVYIGERDDTPTKQESPHD